MKSATIESSSVAGSRLSTSDSTSCLSEIEVPKSPRSTPDSQMKYCSTMRLIEAVERAQPVDVGLAGARRQHHGDRVARRDADDDEHHHRHAEQRDGHGEQADEEALQDHLDSRSQCSFGRAELPLTLTLSP